VITGEIPYGGHPDYVLRHVVVEMNMRPATKPGLSPSEVSYESLWALAEKCWHELPEKRPLATDLVECLST
ncbi:hypothetical protein FRB99_008866, partial [Tulasnella sp. 403]